MKTTLIFSLLFLQTVLLFGQEPKTKKKKVTQGEGTAVFYVLASNDTVKHGDYQVKAYTGNRILIKGSYSNNKKVGLWTEQYYGNEYKGAKASGHYDNDMKTGNWSYFDFEGDTAMIYNWTENRMVFSKACHSDMKEYTVINDGKESRSTLECAPTCVTGRDYFLYEFWRMMGQQTSLFNNMGNDLYQLKTNISVTVENTGAVTEITYSTDEKTELKKVVEDFVKSYKWIPGKKDGKDVTAKFEFPVRISVQY
jgi:hypothetical protein